LHFGSEDKSAQLAVDPVYAKQPIHDCKLGASRRWPGFEGITLSHAEEIQSFDLDCVGSIPAIPPTQFTCFIDEFNKLA
jgi:hypothetical protein